MPLGIAQVLFFKVLFQCIGKVSAGLVGKAEEHPEHIGHFIGQVFVFIAFLEGLLAIPAHHDAGEFAYLFHEDAEVGEFVEIAHTGGAYPFVGFLLGFS